MNTRGLWAVVNHQSIADKDQHTRGAVRWPTLAPREALGLRPPWSPSHHMGGSQRGVHGMGLIATPTSTAPGARERQGSCLRVSGSSCLGPRSCPCWPPVAFCSGRTNPPSQPSHGLDEAHLCPPSWEALPKQSIRWRGSLPENKASPWRPGHGGSRGLRVLLPTGRHLPAPPLSLNRGRRCLPPTPGNLSRFAATSWPGPRAHL